jgi:hypothetical protein
VSDLQLSLLGIGAVVIGGVCLYNWLQERRFRRRLEQAFGDGPDDVLLHRGEQSKSDEGRIEPQLQQARVPSRALRPEGGGAAPAMVRPRSITAELGFDAELDYVAEVEAPGPIAGPVIEELLSKIAECGKPARALGYSPESGDWEEVSRGSPRRYTGLQVALQLVNRSGVVNPAQLAGFCDAARSCAEKASGVAVCPDAQAALKVARELDAFCSGVDVAVGVNVVAQEGITFSGTGIREFAEASGFKLEPDGVFHYRNEGRQTLFTLDNHEPAPFLPEQIKKLTTRGVTLMLDVPRVEDGLAILDGMLDIGRSLAAALGGRLVDDNRSTLSDAGVAKIREQLRSIHAALSARGMPAGGERALRLFS